MSKDWINEFKQKGPLPNFDLSHQPELKKFYYDFPPNVTQQPKGSKIALAVLGSVFAGGALWGVGQWINSLYGTKRPRTRNAEWEEASQKRRQAFNIGAAKNHRVGETVVLPKGVVSETIVVKAGKTPKRSEEGDAPTDV